MQILLIICLRYNCKSIKKRLYTTILNCFLDSGVVVNSRVANRPGTAGTVPELTVPELTLAIPCLGLNRICPGIVCYCQMALLTSSQLIVGLNLPIISASDSFIRFWRYIKSLCMYVCILLKSIFCKVYSVDRQTDHRQTDGLKHIISNACAIECDSVKSFKRFHFSKIRQNFCSY